MEENIQEKKSAWFRIFRILLRITAALAALIIVLVLLLNIPAVQSYIAGRFINNLNQKTGTNASIGSLKIALPNTIRITGLYLDDQQADTLLYLHSLEIDLRLFSLLRNKVAVKKLKIENLVAHIHRKNSAEKFNFQFILDALSSKKTPEETDTTVRSSSPWLIHVNSINLKNIHATYIDDNSGINTRIDFDEFLTSIKNIDLSKQSVSLENVLVKKICFSFAQSSGGVDLPENVASNSAEETAEQMSVFIDWNISVDHLAIEDSRFRTDNTSKPVLPHGLDYEHLRIDSLNAQISHINIDKTGYSALFDKVSLIEGCGIKLKEFTAEAHLTDQEVKLGKFKLITAASDISGDASITYPTYNEFLAALWKSGVKLNINNSLINLDDVLLFAPFLADNSLNSKIKDRDIKITAKATGILNDLNIVDLDISLLHKTSFRTNGRISGLPDITKLTYNVNLNHFSTILTDLNLFIDPADYAGLKMPESFELKGTAKGSLSKANADLSLSSPFGNIAAKGFYNDPGKGLQDTFNLSFDAQQMQAGLILSDTLPGAISISGEAKGKGILNGPFSGNVALDIKEAEYNRYTYNNIEITGRMDGELFSGTAISNDPNLEFNLIAKADLRAEMQKYTATLDLPMVNLRALNFMEDSIALSTNLTVDLDYAGLDNMRADIAMANTRLIHNGKSIPVGKLDVTAISAPDSIRIGINSGPADGTITGNLRPDEIGPVLLKAYNQYFGIADTTLILPGKNLAFSMDVHIPREITANLISGLDTLDISRLEGGYHSHNNELQLTMKMPRAIYSGVQIDSLNLDINGKNDTLTLGLSLGQISYDSILIRKLLVTEEIEDGKILSEISIPDSAGKPAYLFSNEIDLTKNAFSFRFLPNGLVLDGAPWVVDEDNLLKIEGNKLSTNKFLFSKDQQSFGLTANEEEQRFQFKDFELQNLTGIVDYQGKEKLIRGQLNGEVILPNAGNKQHVESRLNLTNLYILDSLAGDLTLNLSAIDDKLNIDTRLESGYNKIRLSGVIDNYADSPVFDLNLLLKINDFRKFEKFSFGYLSDMSGKINGDISLTGTMEKPEMNGYIGFEETAFRINSLNFHARIRDERIQLTNQTVRFDNFVIEDIREKKLFINGNILTTNYTNPTFDLHLFAEKLQAINSTAEDNPLFFGNLTLDTDARLKGDLKSPKIEADVRINKETNLTYVLPGSELQLVTSEGIVKFLEPGQSYDSVIIIKAGDYLTDSIISRLTGIDFSMNLEIDPEAIFTVNIDPKSGDYLTLSGGAKLSITEDATGKQSITGIYEVKSGTYQLSFYGLVKKSFTIKPGSNVSWSGMPLDADVDITAEYVVRTSSVALVANETTSMSEAEKNIFKNRLPYEVRLNIRGFLSQPEISFNLALPDKYMVAYPLIASKLAILNSEEMVSELNKQVFSLLIAGSFLADNPLAMTGGSSGASNYASTAARNSVNGILADQLNNISGKYISGVDVNFGLTTYEDYKEGTSESRTELDVQVSKKLFNDRLTVEAMGSFDLEGDKSRNAGSNSEAMSGEFAVIYDLTESGEYKLRAYLENAYDLFDGDISYSGIALIFEKEFDSFKNHPKQASEKKARRKARLLKDEEKSQNQEAKQEQK